MQNLLIVIPAIKKNAVIPDQLIKKLDGITLIQRAINTAKGITDNILIVTDSEEISLIAQRNSIDYLKQTDLKIDSDSILEEINSLIKNRDTENILLYRANTPLIDSGILKEAYKEFLIDSNTTLVSVKDLDKQLLEYRDDILKKVNKAYVKELKAFYIYNKNSKSKIYRPFVIKEEKSIEIESYHDWWVCEKVLKRKRIVFNVIGSVAIGMGHIYHSLALAHEITDHEVIFVCHEKYEVAVEKIASMDYKVISTKNTLNTVLELKPDLVINDILNTEKNYIIELQTQNIKVVNFEDLGDGSQYADLVFNELYDTPQCVGNNYLWGYEYLALRDEFTTAKPHKMVDTISEILISFGGTDQNNLTLLTLKSILEICLQFSIKIHIVCGSAYRFQGELESYIKQCNYKKTELHIASNSISKIMEKTELAISSNGRTVYELAHMNIPSIIVSHHEREATHTFASLEKGFINLGVVRNNTSQEITTTFKKIVEDKFYRELLFMNIKKYDFEQNKVKVVKKIMELL